MNIIKNNNMNLITNSKNKSDKINFELNDEVKEIIYKELKEAQDFTSPYNLSIRTEYKAFHVRLDNYFKSKGFKNKPTKTDYLAWILLLTYPKDKIRCLENISDLNIHFKDVESDKTDFEIVELLENTEDDMATNRTCVCSTPIANIYKLQNKFSDINIQVGCDCIERHGLVSKTEINECKKKMKEIKERTKEIEEGKPIGYYKEQRENEKLNKNITKLEMEKIKQQKQNEKIKKQEEKLRVKEEKLMEIEDNAVKNTLISNCFKKCLLCKKEGLYNKYNVLIICNKCINNDKKNKIKLVNKLILKNKREYKQASCVNCDINFVYRYIGHKNCFCKICEKSYKKMNCHLCPNEYMDDINSLDVLCNICDAKSKYCLDCNNKFINVNLNVTRCDICQYRFSYKLTVINCNDCGEEVEIKENEKWRKFCSDCYKNNLKYVNCNTCNEAFKRLSNELWRKSCSDCYYKSK